MKELGSGKKNEEEKGREEGRRKTGERGKENNHRKRKDLQGSHKQNFNILKIPHC